MKKIFLLIFAFTTAAHAQDRIGVKFEHTGGRAAIVNKSVLHDARNIHELVPGFPVMVNRENVEFLGIELTATCDGRTSTASSADDEITSAQRSIIDETRMGTEISVGVRYRFIDKSVNSGKPVSTEYAIVVGPDHNAEFPEGRENLTKYFEETVLKQLPEEFSNIKPTNASVGFVVNASGKIIGASVHRSSSDPRLDNLLLEAINKMPDWKPAESSGVKFDQKVIVSVPFGKGGC